jgi:putative endonuclease
MFFVYVLLSLKDKKFYIGQTNNLADRVLRHNEGRVRATRGRRPLILVWSESFPTRAEAVRRERYLKSLRGDNRFRSIIGM